MVRLNFGAKSVKSFHVVVVLVDQVDEHLVRSGLLDDCNHASFATSLHSRLTHILSNADHFHHVFLLWCHDRVLE